MYTHTHLWCLCLSAIYIQRYKKKKNGGPLKLDYLSAKKKEENKYEIKEEEKYF